MRHGNNNLVEGNVFFGNNADHTGGIRVINAGQTIRNNYMEGLKGTRFGGALVVMNGVPNGPINRYDPVKNALIEKNSLINSDNIQLGAGSDEERSGPPSDSRFEDNLIYNDDGRDVFTVYDDMSGIAFSNNVLGPQEPPSFTDGFKRADITLERAENGLMYPVGGVEVGVSRDIAVTQKETTGPSWYPKAEPIIAFGSGQTHRVEPGKNAIFDTVRKAAAGDVIVLSAGDYVVGKFLKLDKPLTFKGEGDVNLTFERSALFQIENGGSLQIMGLDISGADSPDNAGNSVIRTSPYSMLDNYRLEIIDTNFSDIDINHSFNIVSVAKGTFADNILIKNSTFKDISGSVLKLNKEDDDYGIYNAEYVTIENSKFENIGQELISFYRGGTDESTFGPHFEMHNSEVIGVGSDKRNKSKSSLLLHGVQVTNISGNTFKESKPFIINHTVGEPKTKIYDNKFSEVAAPRVAELNSILENTAVIKNNMGLNP
jgi:poly(beta-D-mannuronate) lyase